MLPLATVPPCLLEMLQACRGVFGAAGFATFVVLVVGALGAVGPRTITGIWAATGLAGRLHWSRAHRFFSETRWDPDCLGPHLAHLLVSIFVAAGAAITLAVDDTLFHRYGKLVYGAACQHDGSAKGRDGIGRGNCFVVVGLVVTVPFMGRAVLLPVLFRLYTPKHGPSKTEHASSMVNLLSRAFVERRIHVVADALYRGPAWRNLPGNVTFTTRLSNTAVLYGPRPQPTGKRGHPISDPCGRRRPVPGSGLAEPARERHVHDPTVEHGGPLRPAAAAHGQTRPPGVERPPPGNPQRDRRHHGLDNDDRHPLRRDRRGPARRHPMPVVGQPEPHPRAADSRARPRPPPPRPGPDHHRSRHVRAGPRRPLLRQVVHRTNDQGWERPSRGRRRPEPAPPRRATHRALHAADPDHSGLLVRPVRRRRLRPSRAL